MKFNIFFCFCWSQQPRGAWKQTEEKKINRKEKQEAKFKRQPREVWKKNNNFRLLTIEMDRSGPRPRLVLMKGSLSTLPDSILQVRNAVRIRRVRARSTFVYSARIYWVLILFYVVVGLQLHNQLHNHWIHCELYTIAKLSMLASLFDLIDDDTNCMFALSSGSNIEFGILIDDDDWRDRFAHVRREDVNVDIYRNNKRRRKYSVTFRVVFCLFMFS